MYRLSYFEAHNLMGFLVGMNKYKLIIDLKKFDQHKLFVILGGNGKGKSTFMSLISPLTSPISQHNEFVIPDKEGLLIREYTRGDGQVIRTKCVYLPKGDRHTKKCYVSIKEPKSDTFVEKNTEGLVTGYESLIYSLFDVDEDALKMTMYYDRHKGLIDMTPMERKVMLSKFIKNTGRFMNFFKIVNARYQAARTLMKDVSQKLGKYRKVEELEPALRNIENLNNSLVQERERLLKEIAITKTIIKEVFGDDPETAYNSHKEDISLYQEAHDEIVNIEKRLAKMEKDVNFAQRIGSIKDQEQTMGKSDMLKGVYKNKKAELTEQLYTVENRLMELLALKHSSESVDISDLYAQLNRLEKTAESLEYSKNPEAYDKLYYSEAQSVMMTLDQIRDGVLTIFETHGDLISQAINHKGIFKDAPTVEAIQMNILSTSDNIQHYVNIKNNLTEEFNSLNSYKGLKDSLDKRPKACEIDTCPFISDALRWPIYAEKIEEVKKRLVINDKYLEPLYEMMGNLQSGLAALKDLNLIMSMIVNNEFNIAKYLNVSATDMIRDIGRGIMPEILDLNQIRDIMSILSEKDYYLELTNTHIPKIQKQIVMEEYKQKDFDRLNDEIASLEKAQIKIEKAMSELELKIKFNKMTIKLTEANLEHLYEQEELKNNLKEMTRLRDELGRDINDNQSRFDKGERALKLNKNLKEQLSDIDSRLEPIMRQRDSIKFELQQVLQLNIDKESIELNFLILDALSKMVKPGNGIWVELLDIFMTDVRTTANLLLEKTFGGNLSIAPFERKDDGSFKIPFINNGHKISDISSASSSQATTLSSALTLAILGPIISGYGIICYDELDKDLSPSNKRALIDVQIRQFSLIGITQTFIITHSPEYYANRDAAYIIFPEGEAPSEDADILWVA